MCIDIHFLCLLSNLFIFFIYFLTHLCLALSTKCLLTSRLPSDLEHNGAMCIFMYIMYVFVLASHSYLSHVARYVLFQLSFLCHYMAQLDEDICNFFEDNSSNISGSFEIVTLNCSYFTEKQFLESVCNTRSSNELTLLHMNIRSMCKKVVGGHPNRRITRFSVNFSIFRFSIISIVDIPFNILWNSQFLIWCNFCLIITFI